MVVVFDLAKEGMDVGGNMRNGIRGNIMFLFSFFFKLNKIYLIFKHPYYEVKKY